MARCEVDIEHIRNDYDWKEVFGEGGGGNTTKETEAAPPGSPVDITPPNISDIAEIIAAVNGENDGDEWIGLFRLNDGRYLVASGTCDYTGWDCQAGNSLVVCATENDALLYGLSEQQRARMELPEPSTPGGGA